MYISSVYNICAAGDVLYQKVHLILILGEKLKNLSKDMLRELTCMHVYRIYIFSTI